MKNIIIMIDKVASDLESKGLIKEASDLYVISNSLEKYSWDMGEKPLIVKIKPGNVIKADTMVLIAQLKRDVAQALKGICRWADDVDTNSYDQKTKKTEKFVLELRKELEKANVSIWSDKDLFNGMDVNGWKAGDFYDLSKIYSMGQEIRDRTKSFARNKPDLIGGLGLLETIADTYESADSKTTAKKAGACPEGGCIKKKPNGKWGIISNKTGKLWPADYDTKGEAEDGLQAYHLHKK